MTITREGIASNSAAGPTTTVTVTTGLTVAVGDLIVVYCGHKGATSSISVNDANSVVPTYLEAAPYTFDASSGNLATRVMYGVATSTAALNVTMTVGASRTSLKCIVHQFRSTKPAGWTLGANGYEQFNNQNTNRYSSDGIVGRTSGVYCAFAMQNGSVTGTAVQNITEDHDSNEWVGYRIKEEAGYNNWYVSTSGATEHISNYMFFSDDTEPTTGVRLMNGSNRTLVSSGTSFNFASFAAPTGCVLYMIFPCDITNTAKDVTSITYNGVSFTEVYGDNLSSSGVQKHMSIWAAVGACDGATHVATMNFGADVAGNGGFPLMLAFAGVVSTSVAASHRTIYSAGDGGGGAGADVTVTDSVSGDYILSCMHSYIDGGALACGKTELNLENTHPNLSNSKIGIQTTIAAGASTVMNWTNDSYVTHVAFALVAEAVASNLSPKIRRYGHLLGR